MTSTEFSLDAIKANIRFSPLVRLTAANLQTTSYMSLGHFIERMSHEDLLMLSTQISSISDIQSIEELDARWITINDLLILVEMITRAEGTFVQDLAEANINFHYFTMVIAAELLARKGMLKIDYSKLTFDSELRTENFVILNGEEE